MRLKLVGMVACAVVVLACGGASDGLVGRVTQEGQPVQGALVYLTESPSASTETDADGRFKLSAPSGRHEITARYQAEDGALNEQRFMAEVDVTAELRLPRPTRLQEPVVVDAGTVRLSWNPYSGADFREYKLYRAKSAALDESTGTLVYVGMVPGETEFVDEDVRPGDVFFYRLFVMNDFGRLAGSNIKRLPMPNVNLVQGGDFEEFAVGSTPTGFTLGPDQQWVVSDERAYSGTRSVRGTGNFSNIFDGIKQRIPGKLLVQGARYRLSFRYMREAFGRPDPSLPEDYSNGNFIRLESKMPDLGWADLYFSSVGEGVDTSWQVMTRTFVVEKSGDATAMVCIERSRSGPGPDWVLWVDDMRLERVLE
ncbi:carboxypeptidase regulatory-like domain-containing protein [Myxococcus faecalis]|uniref:carboxypeptidase-like regulatory domain-containing protein n=1 Tax=Myxococcus TaxID=32 RepID=UPI0020C036A8|nr:carboxypeptidase-like regulatory domain-containing protein [Myxococcus fulvus]MCK8498347.1 carboxypeptidase-like regulatory domain-containing protein [Myxococcus fulvus]